MDARVSASISDRRLLPKGTLRRHRYTSAVETLFDNRDDGRYELLVT
jgi:hypothetical protein